MGFPVAHSLSPRLHSHWLAHYGVDGAYVPLCVAPAHLEQALRALPVLGFRGCNLTLPHKEAAMAMVDVVDPVACAVGAINTVIVEEGGLLRGTNTDAFGFLANLRAGVGVLDPYLAHAVVLGAGGAARAVVKALLDAGTQRITLANRTRVTADALANHAGAGVTVVDVVRLPEALGSCSLLVNTTSCGMEGQPSLEVDLTPLPLTALVTDLVYRPLETALLRAARARGNPVVDGLGMLIHQAAPGFAVWFGVMPDVDERVRKALLQA